MKHWSPFLSRLLIFTALLAFAGAGTPPAHAGGANLQERVRAYEASCIVTLRTINVTQITYWGGNETKVSLAHSRN
jgi:hypothetical protein